jgi:hypothetical protein
MRSVLLALALLVGFVAPGRAAETVITILTGPPSAIYYQLGTALSSIYGKAMPGANVTVQATAGSVENLKLLEAGDGELGFMLGSILAAAWAGNKAAGFDAPLTKLRGIGRIYPNFFQIVASNRSGIKALPDLKGKRVSIGPEGSGTAVFPFAGRPVSPPAISRISSASRLRHRIGRSNKANSTPPSARADWGSSMSGIFLLRVRPFWFRYRRKWSPRSPARATSREPSPRAAMMGSQAMSRPLW